jgi:hypothetical protein
MNIKVTVIMIDFANVVHDVRRGKCVNHKYKTILDRLVINEPNVTNFLVKI